MCFADINWHHEDNFASSCSVHPLPTHSSGVPLPNMPSQTIVLVPGAFHVDSSMDVLVAQLELKGYNTRTLGLITVNKPQVSVDEDTKALAEGILTPLIEQQGKDVVLYLHSYAGFPGSAAIAGLSKAERAAKGQQGGIIGLIYQSAFVPKPGNTLLQMIGGSYTPWQDPDVSLCFTCVSVLHCNSC